uniref:HNH endonuclease n=1 Tax=Streptomyces phage Abafar TaxID=3158855 RepID=A0AAU7GW81_9CAUD
MTSPNRMDTLLTREIDTPTGHVILVDDDLDVPSGVYMNSGGYASFSINNKLVPVHQYVMGTYGSGNGVYVDHINRNKLDNRRSNLRLLTPAESNLNRKDYRRKLKLPPNVYRNGSGFSAEVVRNKKRNYLGTFPTPEEASAAAVAFKESNDPEWSLR